MGFVSSSESKLLAQIERCIYKSPHRKINAKALLIFIINFKCQLLLNRYTKEDHLERLNKLGGLTYKTETAYARFLNIRF